MTPETEIMRKILDYFLKVCELNEVIRQKHEAVKAQSFELAVKFRDEEKKLLLEIPGYEELKEMRQSLTNL